MIRLLTLLADLVSRFFKWRDAERLRVEGRNAERKDAAVAVQKEAVDAAEIRQDVRAKLVVVSDADELPDDGFRRD